MANFKLVCVAVVCVALALTAVDANISCSLVTSSLAPCIPYARTGTGGVLRPCCNGIKRLNNAASTTPDRQAACNCMKTASSNLKSIQSPPSQASAGYKLSPSTDCHSVK